MKKILKKIKDRIKQITQSTEERRKNMTIEETKFNNGVMMFLAKNQGFLQEMAEEGNEQARELEKTNASLIGWYERGNSLPLVGKPSATDKKKESRIPSDYKEQLRAHEVDMVEFMLECGYYYPNELHISGVQRSLNTMFKTINQNGLIDRMAEVKECIKRVQELDREGKVQNKTKYLQKSLMNLAE